MRKLWIAMLSVMLSCALLCGALGEVYTDKETVKAAQQALNEAGFDCGTPDGAAGKKTRAAVTAYQQANGLEQTGEIDDVLLVSLGLLEQPDEAEILGTWYWNASVDTQSGETLDPGKDGYEVSLEFRENGEMHVNSNTHSEGGFDCTWRIEGTKIVQSRDNGDSYYVLKDGNLEDVSDGSMIFVYGREKTSSEPEKPAQPKRVMAADFNNTHWISRGISWSGTRFEDFQVAVVSIAENKLSLFFEYPDYGELGQWLAKAGGDYPLTFEDNAMVYQAEGESESPITSIRAEILEDGKLLLTTNSMKLLLVEYDRLFNDEGTKESAGEVALEDFNGRWFHWDDNDADDFAFKITDGVLYLYADSNMNEDYYETYEVTLDGDSLVHFASDSEAGKTFGDFRISNYEWQDREENFIEFKTNDKAYVMCDYNYLIGVSSKYDDISDSELTHIYPTETFEGDWHSNLMEPVYDEEINDYIAELTEKPGPLFNIADGRMRVYEGDTADGAYVDYEIEKDGNSFIYFADSEDALIKSVFINFYASEGENGLYVEGYVFMYKDAERKDENADSFYLYR